MWQYFGAILAILVTLHFYYKRKFSYWSERGLKTDRPLWIVGNLHKRANVDFHNQEIEWIERYGKVYGAYSLTKPAIIIGDCELLKKILIKDFHHFVNRMQPKAYHEMWNQNIFAAEGDAWKRQRIITSPSFSSGKLRAMHAVMQRNIDKLDAFFAKQTNTKNDNPIFEVKQVMAGLTIDVIASTAFATETNSNDDPQNVFVINGRKLFDFNPLRGVACFVLPKWLLDFFNIKTVFDPAVFDFFINLTRHIVAERKSGKSAKRPDLVQLLIDAVDEEKERKEFDYDKMTASENEITNSDEKLNKENSPKSGLTDSEIVANCIIFFVAGFETTASTLTHCVYELAKNPTIQERLANELREKLNRFTEMGEEGEKSEDYFNTVMNEIPFLEAVVKETLRRYPPLSEMVRKCNTDNYRLTDRISLHKDQIVLLSVAGVHLNPEYYPEPRRFDPERFMPENKHLLVPYTYLPFGLGPRNCIAMRFAYQEIKLCLAKIIRRYRFSTTSSTPEQLSFKKGSAVLIADPFYLKVEQR